MSTHTLAEDFEHFLNYSEKVKDPIERLRLAYEHGDERGAMRAKRDEFAGQAMQGLLANSEGVNRGQECTLDALARDKTVGVMFAEMAYGVADAMLKARSSV